MLSHAHEPSDVLIVRSSAVVCCNRCRCICSEDLVKERSTRSTEQRGGGAWTAPTPTPTPACTVRESRATTRVMRCDWHDDVHQQYALGQLLRKHLALARMFTNELICSDESSQFAAVRVSTAALGNVRVRECHASVALSSTAQHDSVR